MDFIIFSKKKKYQFDRVKIFPYLLLAWSVQSPTTFALLFLHVIAFSNSLPTSLLTDSKIWVKNPTQVFTARRELRKVLFWALSVTFLFVYEIYREPLNGFAPHSQRRRVWSLMRTSLKVKVNFGGLCAVYAWKNIFALVCLTFTACSVPWRKRPNSTGLNGLSVASYARKTWKFHTKSATDSPIRPRVSFKTHHFTVPGVQSKPSVVHFDCVHYI